MRSPGRSSVRHCAPSPINAGRVEIVTPDCRDELPLPELSRLRQTVRRGPGLAAKRPTTGRPTTRRPARLSGAGAPPVSMLLSGLVLVGWLLAVRPFAEHARGDRERGVDDDLDVAGHGSAPRLTSGRAIRSARRRRSARPRRRRWLGIHGPDATRSRPRFGVACTGRGRLFVASTQRLPRPCEDDPEPCTCRPDHRR